MPFVLWPLCARAADIARQVAPDAVMSMLNELYWRFDTLCLEMPVYKVETIGDW